MEILLFAILYVTTLLLILILVKDSGISIFKVSIPMVVFWSVLIFAYIGYPFIVFKQVPLYVNQGVTNDSTLWKIFILSTFVWLQFFAGYFVGGRIFKTARKKVIISNSASDNKVYLPLFYFLLFLSIGVLFVYLGNVQNVALFEAINGADRLLIAFYRSEMTNNFSKYHRYALFFNTIIPFLSYIAWSELLITKRRKWLILFVVVFLISVFTLVMDTQKAPIIWYIGGLVAIFWVVKAIKINIKSLMGLGSATLIMLMLMYSVFMGAELSAQTIMNPIQRAFTGQLAPLYWYLEIYPEKHEFVGGRTFPNPGGIMPWESYRYTVEVSNYVRVQNNDLRLENIVGSSPTAFFGELWVNFGIWLNITLPFFLGVIILAVHNQFVKKPIGAVGVSLMIWLAFHFRELSTTGISKYLFDLELYVILVICYLLVQLSKTRYRNINENIDN